MKIDTSLKRQKEKMGIYIYIYVYIYIYIYIVNDKKFSCAIKSSFVYIVYQNNLGFSLSNVILFLNCIESNFAFGLCKIDFVFGLY